MRHTASRIAYRLAVSTALAFIVMAQEANAMSSSERNRRVETALYGGFLVMVPSTLVIGGCTRHTPVQESLGPVGPILLALVPGALVGGTYGYNVGDDEKRRQGVATAAAVVAGTATLFMAVVLTVAAANKAEQKSPEMKPISDGVTVQMAVVPVADNGRMRPEAVLRLVW